MKFKASILLLRAVLSLAAAALGGCSLFAQPTPQALPTIVLDQIQPAPGATAAPAVQPQAGGGAPANSGPVTASAEINPVQQIDLSFASPGFVQQMNAAEGDQVKAGDVLASLDNLTALQSAVSASQQALASAQKDYDSLITNAPLERASAQLALIKAQKTLDDAQKAVQSKQFQRASPETIDIARARLITANQALNDAQDFFNGHSGNTASLTYAEALSELAKARQNQTVAQYNLDYVMGLPSPLDVEEAQANLDLAKASLLSAKAAWDQVKDGPNGQGVVAAQARVSAAQASLAAAQTALDHAVIKAPFDGTVVAVAAGSGQAVNPGQVILTLASLSALQAETTDLSERDINRVSLGQPATVHVTGLGQDFSGKVVKIDSRATKVGGDVVYKVTIQFNRQPAGLRWGMSATVQIGQ